MTFRTNALKVQAFAGALFGVQVGTTTMAQVNADITSNGGLANTLNGYYASSFGSVANATVAASVAANLGLTGDALASGTAYITAQLNGAAAGARGAVISNILDQFAGLTADATFGAAATAYNAKIATAVAYTGAANVAVGTVVAEQGIVFTLTSGADNFQINSATAASKTTAGNDTFRATASGDLASADAINAGAGQDTLNAVQTAAVAGVIVKPLLSSVEVVNVTGTGVGTNSASSITLDLADSTGVEQVWSRDSIGAASASTVFTMNFNNLVSGVEVGIAGGATGAASGLAPSLTVGVRSASTNTADTLKINLSNALANVVTAAEIETITLSNSNTTATASSTVTELAANKVKTLNIDGSGTLTVTGLGSTTATTLTNLNIAGSGKNTITTAAGTQTALKTIDASAATGANTVVITGTAIANTKVTMGSGNDTVTFDTSGEVATAIGTEGAVVGGDGKDTLRFVEATLDATDAAAIAKANGFEVIQTSYAGASNTASVSLTASAFTGISEFVFSGATVGKVGAATASATASAVPGSQAVAVSGIENNDIFIFTANQTGAAAVSVDNSASQGSIATAALTTAARLDNGSNVLNITLRASSTDSSNSVSLIGGLGAAKGSGTVNTGPSAVGVEASAFETVNLSSTGLSASTFTGNNVIVGGGATTGVTAAEAMTLNTNGTLVITGDKHLDLTGGVGGTNVTVNASAFTGMLKVKTNSGNNTLIGGNKADDLEGGAGVDTYTGGAGKDKFIIADSQAGTSGAENITDFELGSDILDLTGTKALIADVVTAVSIASSSTIASIAAGDTLLATVSKGIVTLSGNAVNKVDTVAEVIAVFEALDSGTNNEIGAIVMGGSTYVLFETDGGNTLADVVQLVGITSATAISTTAATGVITIG